MFKALLQALRGDSVLKNVTKTT